MSSPGTPPGQDKVYQVIAQFKLLLGRRGDWEGRVSHDLGAACARVHVQVCGIQGALVDRQSSVSAENQIRMEKTFGFAVFTSLVCLEKNLK